MVVQTSREPGLAQHSTADGSDIALRWGAVDDGRRAGPLGAVESQYDVQREAKITTVERDVVAVVKSQEALALVKIGSLRFPNLAALASMRRHRLRATAVVEMIHLQRLACVVDLASISGVVDADLGDDD